ncbi:MAG TPA: alpha/beta hydrolase, partial [Alphaproteobacteria bacterium]|nr:alpha/beta hydrolase [Alphaproteobacteria bacterium]
MVDVLTAAAAAYAGVNGVLYALQRRLVFVPLGKPGTPAEAGVPDMSLVRYPTGDGLMLEAWFKAPAGRATIVYFHGNAGHFGDRAFKARYFMDRGYGFLLASYRGYAGNPGRPSEAAAYQDARGALDFLAAQAILPSDTVIYGESL